MAVNGTHNGTGTETLTGPVERVSETGIKVQGTWASFSRFHPVERPQPGQAVRVAVDGKGFIKALEVVDDFPGAVKIPGAGNGRDSLIIRQTCLKAAAEFCAARPELKSADLFALAERIEAWVVR